MTNAPQLALFASQASPEAHQAPDRRAPRRVAACAWCDAIVTDGSTCPRSLTCPACQAAPGHPCTRPNGHPADRLHAERITAVQDRP